MKKQIKNLKSKEVFAICQKDNCNTNCPLYTDLFLSCLKYAILNNIPKQLEKEVEVEE